TAGSLHLCVITPQLIPPHLRQSPVLHFAFIHQIFYGSGHILNRYFRIHPVLVKQINAVSAKTLKHSFDYTLYVLGTANEARSPLAGLLVNVPAKLGCDHDLVPERLYGLTEDSLAFMWSVRLGAIEEGDAPVIGSTNNIDHVGPIRHGRFIPAAHVLNTEADTGDLQRPKFSFFIDCRWFVCRFIVDRLAL